MTDTLSLLSTEAKREFDSRYRVVLVAAQRAKHLMRSAPRSQNTKFTKETSIALEETLQGQVDFLMGEEARNALRDIKRHVERDFDKALLAETDEDAKEIKQQLSVYIDDSPKEAEPEAEVEGEVTPVSEG